MGSPLQEPNLNLKEKRLKKHSADDLKIHILTIMFYSFCRTVWAWLQQAKRNRDKIIIAANNSVCHQTFSKVFGRMIS